MLGFSWEIESARARRPLGEVAIIGAPEGGSYGGDNAWLPWQAFRPAVERQISRHVEEGYRLTGSRIGYDS